ncbi:MAG: Hsp20/alpha crystallin family protein [Deltaproteobacteria bacterium]|nr:Hsp20/alpha crystallin family protein [Deltaproteobacteria bacterium]
MSDTQIPVTSPTPEPERVFRRTPELEIVEDDQALYVAADLPGVAPGDVEVSLNDGVLALRGRARQGSNGSTIVTEFVRQLTLRDPARYAGEQIDAVLRHGVLELRIPKHERAKRRQIPVTVN